MESMISRFPNRNRAISTPQLNILLRFHLVPINVIISHGPQTISNLGTGFPLRCFQRLSIPNIATGRSSWRQSPYTRGSFTPVLSYQERISSNINACSRQETNLSYASFHALLRGTDYILYSCEHLNVQSLRVSTSFLRTSRGSLGVVLFIKVGFHRYQLSMSFNVAIEDRRNKMVLTFPTSRSRSAGYIFYIQVKLQDHLYTF